MTSRQQHRRKWILYADDNRFLLSLFKDFFGLSGYHVQSTSDGVTASAYLEAKVRFDLLLLSVELPRVDGFELAKKARAMPHRKQTPIIIFSVEDRRAEALAAGATESVRKPADLFVLFDAAKRLLAASKGA